MNRHILYTLLLTLLPYAFFQPVVNAAGIELVPSSRVILKISDEMTIDDIIRRIYPNEKDLWPQIKARLIETNPNSFVQYSERLIPGMRLKLVDIKRIAEQEELEPKIKVGYVAQLDGQATARDINGKVKQLETNTQIFEGDRLETAMDSSLQLLMDDGAEVHLKADSVLKISKYTITAGYGKDSSSIMDLIRGGLRKITGAIGASASANYQVQTGFATIGIRGTDYVVKLCKQDDCTRTASRNDTDAKLHAVVIDGAITLTGDDETRVLMATGEYATSTTESLVLEEKAPLPVGLLDSGEAQIYNQKILQQESQEDQSSSSTWIWVMGLLLLAVGL
ncbi:MAG: FecR domain-containing protein [Gammaproteobacteria bacterium]|nr:FecR domain-containing protein [Gammaproteobacteria bacterium]MDH3858777.1 FecR domain-containing protein [Gammaproteobacteria bacterium]